MKTRDKLLMGIDLSTSCVGFAIFNYEGELIELTHAQPKHDFNFNNKMEDLYYKAQMLKDFIEDKGWSKERIEKIVIEAPMISSATIMSSAMLNKFHGIFYCFLKEIFSEKVDILYIGEKDARRHAIPEILLDGKLWSAVPKTIRGHKIGKYRKLIVMLQMAKRYPDVKWMLTNNKTINNKNYDMADAMTTAYGYMVMNEMIPNEPVELDSTITFIENYFDYLQWMKTLTGNASEKKVLKVHYLEEYLNINEHLNLEIFV